VRTDLEHAAHVLRALLAFDDGRTTALLRAALRDELDLVRQRVFAVLAIRHGTDALNKVSLQFDQQDARSHALAIEWLDVALTGADRAVVAILQPDLSDRDRMSLLSRRFPLAPASPRAILFELVDSRDRRWRNPWLKACAFYAAASGLPEIDLDLMAAAVDNSTPYDRSNQWGIVEETVSAIRRSTPSH
jgi:hypothetical protein